MLSAVDHSHFACPPSDPGLPLSDKGTRPHLAPQLSLPAAFHMGTSPKMSYGFPSGRIARTDKVPSQEENKMPFPPLGPSCSWGGNTRHKLYKARSDHGAEHRSWPVYGNGVKTLRENHLLEVTV